MPDRGVMFPPIEQLTAQGYDLQFGTHVLGHFYLTKLLVPILQSTAAQTGHPTRVIDVSSSGHLFNEVKGKHGLIDYDVLRDCPERNKKGTFQLYFMSKSGNILLSKARHRAYRESGIVSIALHPGSFTLLFVYL